MHKLTGHRMPVWALCWSPRNENELVSGGSDRSVRVWDIRRAGSCLRALDMHGSTGEGRRLAGIAGRVSASTTVAEAARALAAVSAHSAAVTSVTYAAGGMLLLTAGRDHRMRLWDAHTGAHKLVHYADAFNTARHMKQLAVTAAGGAAAGARVFFPTAEGVAV